ncbi:MAG: cation transporter [bacterium]|nr:cation transporter [bacterium]
MQKTLKIEGMMCSHCESKVKKALEAIPGVQEAQVSQSAGTAVVVCTADVSNEQLTQAVTAKKFHVASIS